jgi:hypothetical protein
MAVKISYGKTEFAGYDGVHHHAPPHLARSTLLTNMAAPCGCLVRVHRIKMTNKVRSDEVKFKEIRVLLK